MNSRIIRLGAALTFFSMLLYLSAPLRAQAPAPAYTCLPSCDGGDGRMLSLTGTSLQTLIDSSIVIGIAADASATSLEIGIFDGNSHGIWDLAPRGLTQGAPLQFTLYADPTASLATDLLVGGWNGAEMVDNDWELLTIPTSENARTPGGAFFYVLMITLDDSNGGTWSNFKIRTTGASSLSPSSFAFAAPLFSGAEGMIFYPNAGSGDLTTTTYDGSWTLYVDVPVGSTEVTFWDGDFDFGSADGLSLDLDDPDTAEGYIPPWATGTEARSEGVAVVLNCNTEGSVTGCPADDRSNPIFARSPAPSYYVTTPAGETFANNNPSGNLEWEQFKISTAPLNRLQMDAQAAALPAGTYTVTMEGIDLTNLNAWHLDYPALGVDESGSPVAFPRPFTLRGSVYNDLSGNGFCEAGESGISNVVVELRTLGGQVVEETLTAADGSYIFGITDATYDVVIAPVNFVSGGALAGHLPTSSGGTLVTGPTGTADFGYAALGSVAGSLWFDLDADSERDSDEFGMNGVTVRLLDGEGQNLASTQSDNTGAYRFPGLAGGSYQVVVDPTTLPVGMVPTFDPDGVASAHSATSTLSWGQQLVDAGFGYALAECQRCRGQMTSMSFRYLGNLMNVHVVVVQKKGNTVMFDGILQPGQSFTINGQEADGTMSPAIRIYVNGLQVKWIATDCTEGVGPGSIMADFQVLYAQSLLGGAVCPVTP